MPVHFLTIRWSRSMNTVVGEADDAILGYEGALDVGAERVRHADLVDERLPILDSVQDELFDAHEHDSLPAVGLEGLLEVGHLGSARRTARIPEVEDDRLAPKVRQPEGLPSFVISIPEELDLEVWSGVGRTLRRW